MTTRTEFEPISMTAIGGPWARRPCASGSGGADRLSAVTLADEAARRRFLERFATAGQARIGHEILVGIERFLAGGGLYAHRGAVWQELPTLLVVLEIGDHDLAEDLLVHGRIEDRAQDFDAAVEVARHQVGGGDVDRRALVRQSVAGAEAEYAAVLKEAADDRLDADALGETGHAGAQAADAAHDEVDLDARARGGIKRVYDFRIDQRVHLHPDGAGAACLGVRDFLAD